MNLQFTIYNLQKKMDSKGQTVIILLMVIVIVLGIGLSVVGRSITEISTATKAEESTRAFSAAEAGIEKALSSVSGVGQGVGGNWTSNNNELTNQSQAAVNWDPQLPKPGKALEYPAFGKESYAQVWLADPNNPPSPTPPPNFPNPSYKQQQFDIYFGKIDDAHYITKPDDKPAVEVNVIYRNGNTYSQKRYLIDSYSGTAPSARNSSFSGCDTLKPPAIETNDSGGANRSFYCKKTIDMSAYIPSPTSPTVYPIMVRVRVLYTNISHPVAVQPNPTSCADCSLPHQINIYKSTGSAGSTQRTLQLFQQKSVMPNIFDYVLFSAGSLSP